MCNVNTVFRSIKTTARVKVTHRSCGHLKAAYPSKISGNYYIDPDGGGGRKSFVAYCDMVDKDGVGVTVVSHDKEAREHVTGCEPAGCFVRDVTYTDVTLTELTNLIKVSSHCEQFIMFEFNNNVHFIEEKSAWWVSRDGRSMYHWGGVIRHRAGCARGITDTCVEGGECNCKMSGPQGWRNNSDLLTDRFNLPVMQLRFGDVKDSWKEGYHTLGKFKCYGAISKTGI